MKDIVFMKTSQLHREARRALTNAAYGGKHVIIKYHDTYCMMCKVPNEIIDSVKKLEKEIDLKCEDCI